MAPMSSEEGLQVDDAYLGERTLCASLVGWIARTSVPVVAARSRVDEAATP